MPRIYDRLLALTEEAIGLKLAHQIEWSWWLVLAPNLVDFVGTQVMASWLRRQQERRGLR